MLVRPSLVFLDGRGARVIIIDDELKDDELHVRATSGRKRKLTRAVLRQAKSSALNKRFQVVPGTDVPPALVLVSSGVFCAGASNYALSAGLLRVGHSALWSSRSATSIFACWPDNRGQHPGETR